MDGVGIGDLQGHLDATLPRLTVDVLGVTVLAECTEEKRSVAMRTLACCLLFASTSIHSDVHQPFLGGLCRSVGLAV